MRQAILPLLFVVLLGVLGFAAWQWQVNREQQAAMAAQMAQLREAQQQALTEVRHSLEAAREEQERMRQTLASANEALAGAGDEASVLLREDLAVASAMRVAVAEYHAAMGRMPANQVEAGLPPPAQYRGKSLRSATVHEDGRIELVFDARSGVDGGRIEFVPDTSHVDAMGLQWRCQTRDYPLIKRIAPACDYIAGDAVAAPAAPKISD